MLVGVKRRTVARSRAADAGMHTADRHGEQRAQRRVELALILRGDVAEVHVRIDTRFPDHFRQQHPHGRRRRRHRCGATGGHPSTRPGRNAFAPTFARRASSMADDFWLKPDTRPSSVAQWATQHVPVLHHNRTQQRTRCIFRPPGMKPRVLITPAVLPRSLSEAARRSPRRPNQIWTDISTCRASRSARGRDGDAV